MRCHCSRDTTAGIVLARAPSNYSTEGKHRRSCQDFIGCCQSILMMAPRVLSGHDAGTRGCSIDPSADPHSALAVAEVFQLGRLDDLVHA